MEDKKRLSYYLKPIKKLRDCKPGEYVYNDRAELCCVDNCSYMEGQYVLHSYGFEMGCSMDTDVYPVTLETTRIMEKMAKHRDKWHESRLMNGTFSSELAERLNEFMRIDPYGENYAVECDAFWSGLDEYFEEMRAHGRALHICN